MKKPELLAPAGSWSSLQAAIQAGANAVYFGADDLNMRINAKNFGLKDFKKITKICHEHKVRAYLTLNTVIFEDDLKLVKKILKKAKDAKVDAVIAWDHAVIKEALKLKLEVHLSTQASIANSDALTFYKKLGVKRFILARELSLEQIKKLAKTNEIECFVHGAMCQSVSGRCFISQDVFGRSANRGDCIQPCRREYLIKDVQEGYELKLGKGYVLSPKDVCALPFLKELKGVSALKIEGRSRSPEYVKQVVSVYKAFIDSNYDKKLLPILMEKLKEVYNREFHSGFYLGLPNKKDFTNYTGGKKRKKSIGRIANYYKKNKVAAIQIFSGKVKKGDVLLIIGDTTGVKEVKVDHMEIDHKEVKEIKHKELFAIKIKDVRKGDQVYKYE